MEDQTLINNIATKSKVCMLILIRERSNLTSSTAKVSFTTISSQISEKLSLNRILCQIPKSTLFNRAKILTTMPSATVSHQCSTKTKQRGTLLESQLTVLVSESTCLIKSESLVLVRPIKIKTTMNSPIKSCSRLISLQELITLNFPDKSSSRKANIRVEWASNHLLIKNAIMASLKMSLYPSNWWLCLMNKIRGTFIQTCHNHIPAITLLVPIIIKVKNIRITRTSKVQNRTYW